MSINDVRLNEIAQAGEKARRLAWRIADLLLSSDVPAAHWDEVGQRVADLLAAPDDQDADDATGRDGRAMHLRAGQAGLETLR